MIVISEIVLLFKFKNCFVLFLLLIPFKPFSSVAYAQSYYYPSNYYNNYPYYVPPMQTYNVCPEIFYFFNYEPFISGEEQTTRQMSVPQSQVLNNPFLRNPQQLNPRQVNNSTQNEIKKNSSAPLILQSQIQYNQANRPLFYQGTRPNPSVVQPQAKQIVPQVQQTTKAEGPFYELISQTYEKCCPLNRNRLTPVKLKDDHELHQTLFESFMNQTHILHPQSQGIYSIMEFYHQQTDLGSFNPFYVQIMNSHAFYLISKRERNGAPAITPIALSILLNAWPMLVFIVLANGFAAVFIWFLDRTLKQRNFPKQFIKGTGFGLWWSYFLFTATSLAPRIEVRSWIVRVFTVIWMMISLVMVVIFISMFNTALTVYALNGQSLNEKIIGLNKFSTDRLWLDNENAVVVEYDNIKDMFRDLDEVKIDYILLDQIFANFYSQLINERFYVMRQVNRKKSYNILLRGFNSEQLTCFQTTSSIFYQQWLKSNLSTNSFKIRDTSKYFNITDELLYPQRNVILFISIGILVMIIIIGVSWQITCMKQPGLSSLGGRGGGGNGAGSQLNRLIREGGRRIRRGGNNGEGGGLRDVGNLINDAADDAAEAATGAGGGGAGGLASILNDNPITGLVDNISSVRNLIPGGLLTPNLGVNDFVDRSVKFNPLVHNFFYNTKPSSRDIYDKALINARNQAILSRSYPCDMDSSDKFFVDSKNWNYFKVNDPPKFDEIKKETSLPIKSIFGSTEYQVNNNSNNNNVCSQNCPAFQIFEAQSKAKNINQIQVSLENTNEKQNITRVDLPDLSKTNYSLKQQINYLHNSTNKIPEGKLMDDRIVLSPGLNCLTSNLNLNQPTESNTDENLEHSGKILEKNFTSSTGTLMGSHLKELPRNESFYLTEYSSVKL